MGIRLALSVFTVINGFLVGNDALFAFKITDALPDQMENLTVTGTAFILGDIVQLVVKVRFNLDPKMLVFLVSYGTPQIM